MKGRLVVVKEVKLLHSQLGLFKERLLDSWHSIAHLLYMGCLLASQADWVLGHQKTKWFNSHVLANSPSEWLTSLQSCTVGQVQNLQVWSAHWKTKAQLLAWVTDGIICWNSKKGNRKERTERINDNQCLATDHVGYACLIFDRPLLNALWKKKKTYNRSISQPSQALVMGHGPTKPLCLVQVPKHVVAVTYSVTIADSISFNFPHWHSDGDLKNPSKLFQFITYPTKNYAVASKL